MTLFLNLIIYFNVKKTSVSTEEKQVKTEKSEKKKEDDNESKEAKTHLLFNPCRVTVSQSVVTKVVKPQRYLPIVESPQLTGIVILKDHGPTAAVLPGEDKIGATDNKEVEYTLKDPLAMMPKNLNEEPQVPEPFFWSPPEGQN